MFRTTCTLILLLSLCNLSIVWSSGSHNMILLLPFLGYSVRGSGQPPGTCAPGQTPDDSGQCKAPPAELNDDDDDVFLDGLDEDEPDVVPDKDFESRIDADASLLVENRIVGINSDQEIAGSDEENAATEAIIQKMIKYQDEEVSQPMYASIRHLCVNKDKLCAFWASQGECDSNPGYMERECALACKSCDIFLDEE